MSISPLLYLINFPLSIPNSDNYYLNNTITNNDAPNDNVLFSSVYTYMTQLNQLMCASLSHSTIIFFCYKT